MASSCWGDVGVLAPCAYYLACGDLQVLRENHPTIKRFSQRRAGGR
jgi:alpha-L-rhamnosidase